MPGTANAITLAMLQGHAGLSAQVLESQDPEDVAEFLQDIPAGILGKVIDELPPSYAARYLTLLPPERSAEIAGDMGLGQLTGVLRCLESEQRNTIVAGLSPRRRVLLGSLEFQEACVGAWIEPDSVVVPPQSSVRDALRRSRRFPGREAALIAVVNHSGRFLGVVDPAKLIRVPINDRIDPQMDTGLLPLRASMDLAEAAASADWRLHRVLPVVDSRDQFIGLLYYHTLCEALERLQGTNSVGGGEDAFSNLWSAYATGLGALTGMLWQILDHGAEAEAGEDDRG